MSNSLNLAADEVVLIKSDRVKHGGMWASYTDTLVLTNKKIVYIKKGVWGNEKEVKNFHINDIKLYNGKPQAILSKNSNGMPVLDIYFISGQESFEFESRSEVVKWCDKINEVITGEKSTTSDDTNSIYAIPGVEAVAKTLKATFDTYKEAFGIKTKEDKKEMVSCHCSGCGAPNKGVKGETVKCPYCGNYITF